MKIKSIIVYGHRGAGKSTLCRELAKVLPGFQLFMIDEYRIRLNPHIIMEGEKEAINAFDDEYTECRQ